MWNSKVSLLNIVSFQRLNFLLEGDFFFFVRGEQAWQEAALGKVTFDAH